MHASVATWIDEAVEWFGLAERRTLEIGVGDPSNWGEEHANPFTGDYTPTDKNPRSEGVFRFDVELDSAGNRFEVVVCTEVLEHVRRPWRAIDNMAKSLVEGGILILTCRGYDELGCAPVHGDEDFWRFTPEAVRTMLEDSGLEVVELQADPDPLWRGVLSLSKRHAPCADAECNICRGDTHVIGPNPDSY